MNSPLDPIKFKRGPEIKNRFFLAPLTNQQSHEDGKLSDEEYKWLMMRAKGGFGLTMTCAAHVQEIGKGFPGQLGIWSDEHLEGLSRIAKGVNDRGSVSIAQLHHAGLRSDPKVIGETPVTVFDHAESGARGLSNEEVYGVIADFVTAARRAEQAGFDGVELHGAHSYLICNFLSSEVNQRNDEFGGKRENREKILFEIIDGIKRVCSPNFIIGVRISAERFGMKTEDSIALSERLLSEDDIDFLDVSLWDIFKEPEDESLKGRTLMSYFTKIKRGQTKLGVAGKIRTPQDAEKALELGADWIMLGRAAMLEHDFPNRYAENSRFTPIQMPVPSEYLTAQGLSEKFQIYVRGRWPEFFAD